MFFWKLFAAGCPLIISDRTPWQNLEEKGIGWSIPLEDKINWDKILQTCVDMDNDNLQ